MNILISLLINLRAPENDINRKHSSAVLTYYYDVHTYNRFFFFVTACYIPY